MDQKRFQQKLSELNDQTHHYLSELRELISQMDFNSGQSLQTISYFTFSMNISHDLDMENLILGTYHIHNLSEQNISNPYICIKLSSGTPFMFSGKYIYPDSQKQIRTPGAWERMNDREDKEEYWLRPLDREIIEPNEMITFPNFQIKWSPDKSYSGSVMGFTYSDQFQDGMASLNQINLSGNVSSGGEGNGEQ
ncbi:hypothetical protein SAMN05216498_1480 [Tenuibacillus multivorans]|uniref:Uncharacterized protein n=1 Tax=Tenuibacillus multivorans TaxID=237069 RepID=A0A1G9YP52_9BACI|nr:hypothetical protein [Tenuibacillus multivorans]SDN10385.1 hypothetical protein SAMN05216498_1480 [Tenuibacillus multivorans]